MRALAIASGASRLVSRNAQSRNHGDFLLPFPDYPSNARSFVHLDARLLPYWHTLFDVCPGLLKLDPPDGLNIFRGFMTWAYRNHPPLNWTYYLSVCRWLLGSRYQAQITEEHVEAFMSAAAARWINTDDSQARGLVLAWRGSPDWVFDWKVAPRLVPAADGEPEEYPPVPWDFAWCPLSSKGGSGFRRWLPIP
ncbi:putative natural product biosynthesis protein [Pseudomonas protegens]|uniref:Natural product biosynthesis protein n=1 Tax=Pseudomonas idahonensis TaxID=2942628 RepID=A0ABT5Q0Z6_9PSED|nr:MULTISPECIES: putative natural product biosynthesis protein [Pseudomonas]MDD1147856.1 putative natural product biosynthesis protein [Pseudomonas idahonensis]MDP9514177.1 putative natural product biosynthesis protein [Pseudomonas protegens]MDP9531213.1 putative natural product biosynthesis protein [Pseudomonas protegens]WOE82566.1 putative natural product biosynthesis protein [Pseudomonas protegens]